MNSSACPSSEALNAYFDNETSPAARTTIDTHLPECAGCRKELEWFGLLNELGPRVEESLPGESYWQDLPHRVLGLIMVEEEVEASSSSSAASVPSTSLWRRLWGPSPSWRYVTAGVASLAVIGGAWIITRNHPSPWIPDASKSSVTATAENDMVPLPPELMDETRPLANQSAASFTRRVFDTYGTSRETMGTSLDLTAGRALVDQGHSNLGVQASQMGSLNPDMRALAEEVVPYGCGEDSLTEVYIAALHAEQAGDFRTAALGYRLLMDRVPQGYMLHQYADYRLNYLVWKLKMQAALSQQAHAIDELNRIADHAYQTWEKTGTDSDCRKAWCMNRVLQQLGPEVTEPNHVQMASTRVQVLQDCGH
jgi:Putative zinc-finger